MSSETLDYLDPLPHILEILKLLRTNPDNAAQLATESAKLKNVLKSARASAAAIDGAELGVEDQKEVIRVLQARVKDKTQMLAGGKSGPAQVKSEQHDTVMVD